VKFVTGLGVDVNAINHAGETALHRAAAKRYLSVVQFLVDNNADVNAKTRAGLTPLSIAMAERPLPVGGGDVRYWRRARERVDAPREKLAELLRQLGARE
jgi:ankyrin repeat protein